MLAVEGGCYANLGFYIFHYEGWVKVPTILLKLGGFNFEVHNDVTGSFRLKDLLWS